MKERAPWADARVYAEERGIPIIADESARCIEGLIREHGIRRILEIGTAVGYSAIRLASVSAKMRVVTLERNAKMIEKARDFIRSSPCGDRVTLIEADALCWLPAQRDTFDMLFIDAAKSRYKAFFDRFTPHLRAGGVVVVDNVLFRGLDETALNRRQKPLVKKIERFNRYFLDHEGFDAEILEIGDGLGIAVKKGDKDGTFRENIG